jgi:hypothetical protein
MSDDNLKEEELRQRLLANYEWPSYFELLLAIADNGKKLMQLRKKCKLYLQDLETQMENYFALPAEKRIAFLGQMEKRNYNPTPQQIAEEEQEVDAQERKRVKRLMENEGK